MGSPAGSVIVGNSIAEKTRYLFWLGFWLLLAKFILQSTVFIKVDELFLKFLLLFGILFLVMRVAFMVGEHEHPVLVGVTLVIAAMSYALSGETILLTTFLVIFGAAGIGSQKILGAWLKVVGVLLSIMLLAYAVEQMSGYSSGMVFKDIGGFSSERNALYFNHPNYCAAFFFAFALAFMCRRGVSIPAKVLIYLGCLSVIYFIAASRTSALTLMLFSVFVLVLKLLKSKRLFVVERGAAFMVPIFLMLLTLWIAVYWYTSSFYSQSLNDLLTGRPTLWWAQWSNVGFSLFGQRAFTGQVITYGTIHSVSTIDSFYSYMIFNAGIAGFICILVLYWRWLRTSFSEIAIVQIAALMAVWTFGFCEWHAINVLVCIPLVMFADTVFLKNGIESSGT